MKMFQPKGVKQASGPTKPQKDPLDTKYINVLLSKDL